ncbi:exoribonuclease [Cryptosporidium sp. chipmunk genotype I]|uniref:exoribonuclease n=1 Tax=Cryptosporidium sp. chipmunk genotype I TaxID=1280935 RepID=UPI00351A2217|nr:exoribonuclease [Cryptosporidium sp. chipmunk genotype I]
MGVPTFYRWLCNRYPLIVKELKDAVDEDTCLNDLDLTEPNINGEFDCLYLDMNGIIHPCCNPSGGDKPKNEAEMFTRVCDYIDRLYAMVRPRRLIYMAIDGVAPRAKMNQQRSRRYKTALEMDYNRRAYEIAQEEFCKIGYRCPEYVEKWDSNVITPGTPFMERLTMCLHAYIRRKFEVDESWRSISVIFSDSNIPGEGEHKILEFIRSQRSNEDYDPNTRHVLYGSDADLIMLGLSTHESHFYIIREAVRDFKVDSPSSISIVYNAWIEKIKGLGFENKSNNNSGDILCGIFENGPNVAKKLRIYSWWSDIEIVDLSMLREYLNFDFSEIREQIGYMNSIGEELGNGGNNFEREHEMEKNQDFKYDFERCIDDFVFLCFFIGNDFLPNLPVFNIYKGSLDQILGIYIRVLPRIGEYLTLEGNIIPNSIIQFFNYLRDLEYEIIIQESRFNQRIDGCGGERGRRIGQNTNIDTGGQNINTVEEEKSQNSIVSSSLALNASKSVNSQGERPRVSLSEIELLFGDNAVPSGVDSTTNINTNTNIEAISATLEEQEKVEEEEEHDSLNKNLKKKRRFNNMESYFQEHLSKLVKYLSEVEDYNEENILMDNNSSSNLNNRDNLENNNNNSNDKVKRISLNIDNPKSILRYRLSYYNRKFNAQINFKDEEIEQDEIEERKEFDQVKSKLNEISDQVCIHYLRGLSWVLGYYYHGVPSWDWYYPYHYAPYVMDIVEALSNFNNQDKIKESLIGEFKLGKPFTQFEQLMSVLPPKSGKICLPKEFYNMMIDKSNPLSQFYPNKFKQDPNGNKQRWKWVALLPFIDQKVLLDTVMPLEKEMDVLSKYRNKLGCDILYSFKYSPINNIILENSQEDSESNNQFTIKMTDMPIFGYIQNYYSLVLKIHDEKNQDLNDFEQVTIPIIETCENIQQGKEIIRRMLNDDGNKRNWKSILESSFNYKIKHPNYVIGYFKLEKIEKKIIWKDPKNENFQMFKVGFGSKMLPNARLFSNSISEFDLNNQERKFKGFKANQSQKILFKLFNYWNLNIDFKQLSSSFPRHQYFQGNQSNYNNYHSGSKRFRDQFDDNFSTSLSSFHSNHYKQEYETGYHNYDVHHNRNFSSSSKRVPATIPISDPPYDRSNSSDYQVGSRLYDSEYFSRNKNRIFGGRDGEGGTGGRIGDYRNPGHYQYRNSSGHGNIYKNPNNSYNLVRYSPLPLPYSSTSSGYYRPSHDNGHLQEHSLQSGMKVTPCPNGYNFYYRDPNPQDNSYNPQGSHSFQNSQNHKKNRWS